MVDEVGFEEEAPGLLESGMGTLNRYTSWPAKYFISMTDCITGSAV